MPPVPLRPEWAAELAAAVRGSVRFDAQARALYATDASNYRQVPIGVVVPLDIEDVVAAVAVAHRHGVPLLGRGGGTSLAGQCCNRALIIDMSKHLRRVLAVDPERLQARVEPGTVLDDLRDQAAAHGLTFGPDPATHSHCTLGGMVGNNSCGVHSLTTGRTSDNIDELEVLTHDGLRLRVGRTPPDELEAIVRQGGRRGDLYARLRALRDRHADLIRRRFPRLPRRVSGYNLDELLPENGFHLARALAGTESTCVTILEITARLVAPAPARTLVVLVYPTIFDAADHVVEVLAAHPIGLEAIDRDLLASDEVSARHRATLARLPPGDGWLLVELAGADAAEAGQHARDFARRIGRAAAPPGVLVLEDPAAQSAIWRLRESGLAMVRDPRLVRDVRPGWEDSAVPPERLASYLRGLRGLLDEHGYHGGFYGHFGDGCVHTRIDFDLESGAGALRFRAFMEAACDLVLAHGGSLSGEHGDGQARGELLVRMFGAELVGAFREFKAIWDPDGLMNPGKVVDPYPLDTDLRHAPAELAPDEPTWFRFPADRGSLARAVGRCVGIGRCRQTAGGVMCPSYMVTRDEEHSTRGRARLLGEMLNGEVLTDGFRSREVKDALDLCLACKGCKSDCPAGVDIATYKAEFLAHYYRHRLRPRAAYALGLVSRWARLGARVPALVNLVTGGPATAPLVKWLAGIHPARTVPKLAAQSFQGWFAAHRGGWAGAPPGPRERVVLWPDTFTNYFHPEVGRAAVVVLEAAGYEVVLPRRNLCCGRPLFDHGMLGRARRELEQVVITLAPEIERGTTLVGLEPSCLASFRDELPGLLPDDPRAARLAGATRTLSEALLAKGPARSDARLAGTVLFHGHCHQKAVGGMAAERSLLTMLGATLEEPEPGCCGMAGAFGFEPRGYAIAKATGERALLPAIRRAPAGLAIVADGFSCREQIRQETSCRAQHLAEVLAARLAG